MAWSFWAAYLAKLAILALLLAGLYALARFYRAGFGLRRAERHVEVLESRLLSQNAAVHLMRVGARYLLVGAGPSGISKLAEWPGPSTGSEGAQGELEMAD